MPYVMAPPISNCVLRRKTFVMKSKLIAALIGVFVLVVSFNIGYSEINLDHMLLNAGMMVVTIFGALAAMYIGTYEIFDKSK